jgi:hypothetical protein
MHTDLQLGAATPHWNLIGADWRMHAAASPHKRLLHVHLKLGAPSKALSIAAE